LNGRVKSSRLCGLRDYVLVWLTGQTALKFNVSKTEDGSSPLYDSFDTVFSVFSAVSVCFRSLRGFIAQQFLTVKQHNSCKLTVASSLLETIVHP